MAQDKEFLGSTVVRTPVFHPRRPPVKEKCAWPVEPLCNQLGDFARGFCARHFLMFRDHCLANGSWTSRHDRDEFLRLFLHPELPHWTWEGDEASLIAMLEARDQEKQNG